MDLNESKTLFNTNRKVIWLKYRVADCINFIVRLAYWSLLIPFTELWTIVRLLYVLKFFIEIKIANSRIYLWMTYFHKTSLTSLLLIDWIKSSSGISISGSCSFLGQQRRIFIDAGARWAFWQNIIDLKSIRFRMKRVTKPLFKHMPENPIFAVLKN